MKDITWMTSIVFLKKKRSRFSIFTTTMNLENSWMKNKEILYKSDILNVVQRWCWYCIYYPSWLSLNDDDKGKLIISNAQIRSAITSINKLDNLRINYASPIADLMIRIMPQYLSWFTVQRLVFTMATCMTLTWLERSHFEGKNILKIQSGKFDNSAEDKYIGYTLLKLHQNNCSRSSDGTYFRSL